MMLWDAVKPAHCGELTGELSCRLSNGLNSQPTFGLVQSSALDASPTEWNLSQGEAVIHQ